MELEYKSIESQKLDDLTKEVLSVCKNNQLSLGEINYLFNNILIKVQRDNPITL